MKDLRTSLSEEVAIDGLDGARLAPRRLFDGGNARERELLDSARFDAAPAGASERVAAALRQRLSAALPRAPGGAALTGTSLEANGVGVLGAQPGRIAAWLGSGVALAVLAGAMAWSARTSPPAMNTAPPSVPAHEAPAWPPEPTRADPAAPAAASSDVAVVESAPASRASVAKAPAKATHRTAKQASAPHAAREAALGAGGLLEEVRALDAVRVALRRCKDGAAARALDSYRERFAAGELALEAEVLGIDIALCEGREAEAISLARALLDRPGAHRYAAHLQGVLRKSGGAQRGVVSPRAPSER